MRTFLTGLALFANFALLPLTLMAQVPVPVGFGAAATTATGRDFGSRLYREQPHKTLAGRVYSPKGQPVPNALVEITNNVGVQFQAMVTDREGDFQADFNFLDPDVARNFVATLNVTKKGFEVAHRLVEMKGAVNQLNMAINLRARQEEDPSLLSQADLIKGVAPRLRQLGTADGLQDKQQKDYTRGVQDFLDRKRLDDAVQRLVKVAMLDPTCMKCRMMLALAELSWGDWDDPRHELVDSINTIIKDPKQGIPEPFFIYGVMTSWNHDPAKAMAFLREATKYTPNDPLVWQELGRAECQDMFWYNGNESLQKALAAGAGPEARLMHAESLLWVGTPNQAMAEMDTYLNGRPIKSMPPRVRDMYDHIKAGKKDQSIVLAARAKAVAQGIEPLDYLQHPPKNLPDFEPAKDQALLPTILGEVGKGVSEMFTDFPSLCSVEQVHEESLNRNGKTATAQDFTYRYALAAVTDKSGPSVDEYRADTKGNLTNQMGLSEKSVLTEGFVSAPLVFHPSYQSGISYRLLGRQKVNGRSNYVIVYAQIPGKSSLTGMFLYGTTVLSTYTQGIAWIDAETYRIMRLTSDLLYPLPQVRLDKETTDINFREVQFKQVTQKFWLPETVTVTLDWNGRTYRNNHAYSDFLVSNVEATQKIGKPKEQQIDPDDPLVPPPAPGTNPLKPSSVLIGPEGGKPPAN